MLATGKAGPRTRGKKDKGLLILPAVLPAAIRATLHTFMIPSVLLRLQPLRLSSAPEGCLLRVPCPCPCAQLLRRLQLPQLPQQQRARGDAPGGSGGHSGAEPKCLPAQDCGRSGKRLLGRQRRAHAMPAGCWELGAAWHCGAPASLCVRRPVRSLAADGGGRGAGRRAAQQGLQLQEVWLPEEILRVLPGRCVGTPPSGWPAACSARCAEAGVPSWTGGKRPLPSSPAEGSRPAPVAGCSTQGRPAAVAL